MENKKPTYIEGVGFRFEVIHSMLRRMKDHNYQSRCIYMITICTENREPLLGTLRWTKGQPEDAVVQRTPLGDDVAKCWAAISSHYHGVDTFPLMVMPDHIHGILFVTRDMECHLGQMIKGFKIGCTHALWEIEDRAAALASGSLNYNSKDGYDRAGCNSKDGNDCAASRSKGGAASVPASGTQPKRKGLFSSGYQDSILMGKGQLNNMFNYLAQNPYRLAMKRENPDLFRVVNQLKIGDQTFAAIGNRWLLNRPVRMQVRCHNNTTPQNLQLIQSQKSYFLQRGVKGGVVVSPCISAGEKEIARAALDAGVPLIVILENGFPPMYKPPGKYFEACANGQLLMLAPWPYHTERRTITRSQCLALNSFAETISTEPWTAEMEKQML